MHFRQHKVPSPIRSKQKPSTHECSKVKLIKKIIYQQLITELNNHVRPGWGKTLLTSLPNAFPCLLQNSFSIVILRGEGVDAFQAAQSPFTTKIKTDTKTHDCRKVKLMKKQISSKTFSCLLKVWCDTYVIQQQQCIQQLFFSQCS